MSADGRGRGRSDVAGGSVEWGDRGHRRSRGRGSRRGLRGCGGRGLPGSREVGGATGAEGRGYPSDTGGDGGRSSPGPPGPGRGGAGDPGSRPDRDPGRDTRRNAPRTPGSSGPGSGWSMGSGTTLGSGVGLGLRPGAEAGEEGWVRGCRPPVGAEVAGPTAATSRHCPACPSGSSLSPRERIDDGSWRSSSGTWRPSLDWELRSYRDWDLTPTKPVGVPRLGTGKH